MAHRMRMSRTSTGPYTARIAPPQPAFGEIANFDIPWKISSDQFDDIPTTPVLKSIVTVYKNAAFNWRTQLTAGRKKAR